MADKRFGFHYFPDTLHYREADLQAWLPQLQALGASWLVIRSELGRAIPELFLSSLKQAKIEPIIQLPLQLDRLPDLKDISTLLEVYARWGARYLVLFDRPNARSAWPASSWVQQDLVERFLDRFLPVASLAHQLNLKPVFPALEPGGSYWDTAFLSSSLQAMLRRKQDRLLHNLTLAAYAWTGGHPFNWGAGGPARWPQSKAYQVETKTQDQRGFRIFEWYQAAAQNILRQSIPVILLQAGFPGHPDRSSEDRAGEAKHRAAYASITRLLAGEPSPDPLATDQMLEPIPSYVISSNFWVLSADPESTAAPYAWFNADGSAKSVVGEVRLWREQRARTIAQQRKAAAEDGQAERSIQHYLLLPGHEWGISDWYLEVIRPFVKKHRPTIGFSPDEAKTATRVTVVGNPQNYPDDMLTHLMEAGCEVEQINGDGTNIASLLAER